MQADIQVSDFGAWWRSGPDISAFKRFFTTQPQGLGPIGFTPGGIMERPMSITVVDEDTPAEQNNAHRFSRENVAVQENTAAADHSVRLPSFDESCPHVRDQIIRMNGGRFNVDHYLRVLRAKAELDVSIAMALTAAGQQKIRLPSPARYLTFLG